MKLSIRISLLIAAGGITLPRANHSCWNAFCATALRCVDECLPDLLAGDVRTNFLTLMKLLSERWNDELSDEVFRDERN